jgi:hypothetical protein
VRWKLHSSEIPEAGYIAVTIFPSRLRLLLTIGNAGMAARLSADLGLHLDLTDHVQKGILDQRALDARNTAFWGVFIHDKYVRCQHKSQGPDALTFAVCGLCT